MKVLLLLNALILHSPPVDTQFEHMTLKAARYRFRFEDEGAPAATVVANKDPQIILLKTT
jgi:hypothetical protein